MNCGQCGAYSESNVKYCPMCGAPMPAQGDERIQAAPRAHEEDARPGWGFVSSPKWPKPEFSVSKAEEPIPAARQVKSSWGNAFTKDKPPAPDYTPPAYNAQPAPVYEEPPAPIYRAPAAQAAQSDYIEDDSIAHNEQAYDNIGYDSTGYDNSAYDNQGYGEPAYSGSRNFYQGGYQDGFGRAPDRAAGFDDDGEDGPVTAKTRSAQGFNDHRRSILPKSGAPKRLRRGGSSLRGGGINPLFIVAGAAVVILGLLIFGIVSLIKNYGSVGGFFSSVFGGSPITKPATIEEGLDDDGVECYIITIYAKEGNVVTARAGDAEISGAMTASGMKKVRIPKHRFLPEEPVEEATVELKADVRITTPDGEVVPVDVPAVTVNVPSLDIEIASPSGSPAYVNRSKLSVSGKVLDGDVSVSIEGQALDVDESGNFSGEYTLPGLGVYSLTIEAKKAGYQIARKTVSIDYSVAEAEIELDKKTLRTPNNSNKTTVKGTLTAGSTMQITAPPGVTAGEPSVDSSSGAFSFDVEIDSEGSYIIDIVVTKDGLNTQGEIIVERAPVLDTYSRACQRMDYTRMTTEPTHSATYVCSGKVTEVLQTEPYIVASLQTDAGDVIFEYHGTAASVDANDGRTYNVYGDYRGIHEETGLPLIYGWFIIKPG